LIRPNPRAGTRPAPTMDEDPSIVGAGLVPALGLGPGVGT